MQNKSDVLGTFALAEKLDHLQGVISNLIENQDPFADLVTEAEFSQKLNIPASTIRGWRNDPKLKRAWVKKGKHIWWSPKKFREKLLE